MKNIQRSSDRLSRKAVTGDTQESGFENGKDVIGDMADKAVCTQRQYFLGAMASSMIGKWGQSFISAHLYL